MKNKLLFILGLMLGCIPIYMILGWIIIFNQNPELSQIEKVVVFDKNILFGLNSSINIVKIHLIVIFTGFIAIFIFSRFLNISYQRAIKNKKKGCFILHLVLLIIFSLFTFLNIFSIL